MTLSSSGKLALGEAADNARPASSSAPNPSGSNLSGSVESSLQRQFSVTDSNRVVLKIIDSETKDVVKQIPPEGDLRLREAIRDQAENFSSTDEPGQP
ncbi:MAG: flagellar protein FlaG [Nitrospinales bacterium]